MSFNYENPLRPSFSQLGWSEDFVQDLIANDPSVLGLGELKLHERERRQPSGGRLDLLLTKTGPEDNLRYAVEVQLGATDPHHILRTIEYWDIERRRFPQYEYQAGIVAGEITSRYFNVVSLFNQYIPIIAIKMTPISLGDHHSIVFTKILDYSPPGVEEEDATPVQITTVDWEKQTSKDTMSSVEAVVRAAKVVSESINPKFNKGYIQLKIGGSFFKLLTLWPKKTMLQMELPIDQSDEVERRLDEANIRYLGYDERRKRYILILLPHDATRNNTLLTELIGTAYLRAEADDNG